MNKKTKKLLRLPSYRGYSLYYNPQSYMIQTSFTDRLRFADHEYDKITELIDINRASAEARWKKYYCIMHDEVGFVDVLKLKQPYKDIEAVVRQRNGTFYLIEVGGFWFPVYPLSAKPKMQELIIIEKQIKEKGKEIDELQSQFNQLRIEVDKKHRMWIADCYLEPKHAD